MAPRAEGVTYRTMRAGLIPVEDASMDVVWCCLVLGGIHGGALDQAAQELIRVLRVGGLLFLVENTTPKADSGHWAFRSAQDYQDLFKQVPLVPLASYIDLGETITAMVGRKL
jgi:ubiquinone/menaquinone biosynthesis C-methylase UbiE